MALHNDFQMNPDIFLNVKEKKKKRLENIVPQKLFLSPTYNQYKPPAAYFAEVSTDAPFSFIIFRALYEIIKYKILEGTQVAPYNHLNQFLSE